MLKGTCNQCGNCCFLGEYKCTNLIVTGEPGRPMATRCAVYGSRYPDMPITLRDGSGRSIGGYCLHNTGFAEEVELTKLIIERKCVLEVSDG
jgi:hypothetical protein